MLDWTKIKTVLLDMDGTLLDLHFDNYFWHEYLPQCWAKKHTVSLQQAKAHLMPIFKQEEGTLQWYCLDYWSERLEMNMIELKNAIKHKIKTRPDTIDFLNFLKSNNKTIVMVTNAHPDLIQMKFFETNIAQYFHNVISSHILGIEKENVEFWHKLADEVAFDKSDTVLIDDNINVLSSAREYGIGNLISIKRPDSQKPLREIEDFYSVDLFSEIM